MKGYDRYLGDLRRKGLLRKPVCAESSRASRIVIEGRSLLNFSSNDYLNLSGDARIIGAAVTSLKLHGVGSGASRLLSGTVSSHQELEERLAAFKKTRAALLFNSGYSANAGAIPALSGKESIIFSDQLNHASIIDGIRISGAEVNVYGHRDVAELDQLLAKAGRSRKRKLIITDSVFSMDGDIAPITDIVGLAKKHDALLMVDDAHGTGVLGMSGRGALEHFGVQSRRIIEIGTLSKAAGCFGGFVAASRSVVDLLINRARSFIYSTSLPPAIASAAVKALDIMEYNSTARRNKLWSNRDRLFRGLEGLGFDTLGSETPIIPLLVGDVTTALRIGRHLYRKGIYAPAIRPPSIPKGTCRIRFSVTAGHTREDIDRLLECLWRFRP